MNKGKRIIPFLYYVKNGDCKANNEMPNPGEKFAGWLSAAHVLRNQRQHKACDVEACVRALRRFFLGLSREERIKQRDLVQYVA